MSSKNKYGKFKKKHYVRTMRWAVWKLCNFFGYVKAPCLIETEFCGDTFMAFFNSGNYCAILYDYKYFKKIFGNEDYEIQQAYVGAITAHEMRHYYQHRQLEAKKPKEKEKILVRWRENDENFKQTEDGYSLTEYAMQPLELDASLFEYVFGAEYFGKLLGRTIKDVAHFNAMEKLYEEYFGEKDPELFHEEMLEILRGCEEKTA